MNAMRKVSVRWILDRRDYYYFRGHCFSSATGFYTYYFHRRPSVFVSGYPPLVYVRLKFYCSELLDL